MPTLSLQSMPNGYELETPTFWYWMKAGMAFTLGAGVVTVTSVVLYWLFVVNVALGFMRMVAR